MGLGITRQKNYFLWNKVKNAQTVIWVLNTGSNQRWEHEHEPPTDVDLPTDNMLRFNEFYDMRDATSVSQRLAHNNSVQGSH